MDSIRPATTVEGLEPVYWLNPSDYPPPPGCKLFLLTEYKTAVVGKWEPIGYIGWRPLFKLTDEQRKYGRVQ